ncbi:MAG: bifunctional diaminohydroxyphosphoribosylaminopyrimidine deaminase/5-amino-6-(5-phosphoribosylamino)uracil reductase RibD [candidate division NC10 bacterium]|nr:bifunctional diaminohydroxyphosphoribosylaminopyrimidine deaminase/5-amino-6-(5-phosphoribosylamino)uracil reductase RibD [candidate division NC10 bacterium]
MERALSLAARGKGRTSPNPMVGAVVVKQGLVVGEGYHLRAGSDHAEVMALREAKESAADATLYVSLEPCCHYGRTPPCTERIIESRIRRVVASMLDPNPLVCGKGFARLKEAGLQVEWGLMEEESRRLNEAYVKWVTTGMPFVILKGAVSLDGKIATRSGESKWITGEAARQKVHQLRSEVDAVMVGIGTILKDDPQLTTRLPSGEGKDPLRIILDTALRLPPDSKVVRTDSQAGTLLVTSLLSPPEKLEELRSCGVEVWTMEEEGGRIPLRPLLKRLGEREITSLMIEGGSELNAAALEEGIADKVILFLSPRLIGGASAPSWIGGKGIERLEGCWSLKNISLERVGDDIMIEGYLQPPGKTACSLG